MSILLPLGPRRDSDLRYTWRAVSAHGEKILAHTRLLANRSQATEWGVLINQSGARRKWARSGGGTLQHCHLLDLIELDEFGVHALTNHEVRDLPANDLVALCPWFAVATAATCLRVRYVGSHLHPCTAPEVHAELATSALKLPERPANDNRLPGYSKTSSGALFRCDAETARNAQAYFNLPASPLDAEPSITELGADSCLAQASAEGTTEPLRLILTSQLSVGSAIKELTRWQRFVSRHSRETRTP
jgi:hypothetical protein